MDPCWRNVNAHWEWNGNTAPYILLYTTLSETHTSSARVYNCSFLGQRAAPGLLRMHPYSCRCQSELETHTSSARVYNCSFPGQCAAPGLLCMRPYSCLKSNGLFLIDATLRRLPVRRDKCSWQGSGPFESTIAMEESPVEINHCARVFSQLCSNLRLHAHGSL